MLLWSVPTSKLKAVNPRDALIAGRWQEHLFRYIDVIDPDYIQIENVEEFIAGEIWTKKGSLSAWTGQALSEVGAQCQEVQLQL